jgi:hypothetical protein
VSMNFSVFGFCFETVNTGLLLHLSPRLQFCLACLETISMDLKEVQERLKYLNNVGHSVFPGEMFETTGNLFKQQLNSKLQGKFESICHEQSLCEFHYTEQFILQKDDELTLHVGERLGVKKRKREVIVDDKSARDAVADRCLGCRSVFVPGVTLRMRVSYEESNGKGKGKGQNRGSGRGISLECLCCGVVAVVKGAGMHNRLSGGEADTDVSPGIVAVHAPLNTLPVPLSSKTKTKTTATATAATSPTTGSKNSKKRKKGGLGALLAAKRQKEAAGGAQAAFGLFGL